MKIFLTFSGGKIFRLVDTENISLPFEAVCPLTIINMKVSRLCNDRKKTFSWEGGGQKIFVLMIKYFKVWQIVYLLTCYGYSLVTRPLDRDDTARRETLEESGHTEPQSGQSGLTVSSFSWSDLVL